MKNTYHTTVEEYFKWLVKQDIDTETFVMQLETLVGEDCEELKSDMYFVDCYELQNFIIEHRNDEITVDEEVKKDCTYRYGETTDIYDHTFMVDGKVFRILDNITVPYGK